MQKDNKSDQVLGSQDTEAACNEAEQHDCQPLYSFIFIYLPDSGLNLMGKYAR